MTPQAERELIKLCEWAWSSDSVRLEIARPDGAPANVVQIFYRHDDGSVMAESVELDADEARHAQKLEGFRVGLDAKIAAHRAGQAAFIETKVKR